MRRLPERGGQWTWVRHLVVALVVVGSVTGGGVVIWGATHTTPADAPTATQPWSVTPALVVDLPESADISVVPASQAQPAAPRGASSAGVATGRARSPSLPQPEALSNGSVLVPSLGIHAPTRPSEIRDGELELPTDPGIVGIWSGGSIVLAGHVNQGGRWGALVRMSAIRPGASLWLRLETGELTHWRARDLAVAANKTAHAFFTPGGEPQILRVVTCGGPFERGHYRDNVVVEFERVPRG